MLKSICYKSTLRQEYSVLKTESLLSDYKKRNTNLNIRGLLNKCKTNYFQIIEGEVDIINALFNKIKADKSHKNIEVIIDMPIMEYTFNDFTTGYCKVDDIDTLYGLQEYHTYLEKNKLLGKDIFTEIISNLFNLEL